MRLGPYECLRPIAQGGEGALYRAVHVELRREVALKVVPLDPEDPLPEQRFRREMRIAASLAHPHIVRVYDAGVEGDRAYVAMELLEGEDLQQLFTRAGALEWPRAVHLVRQAAAGLAHLHQQLILHRDLKPSNVFVDRAGGVRLLDFGLARRQDSTQITRPGTLLGTPLYLPPEVLEGRPLTEAADAWGLGCILYRALTGRPHLASARPEGWMRSLLADPIVAPRAHVPALPAALSDLTLALLARDPAARPSAAHVVAALDALPRPRRPRPRRGVPLAVAALGGLAVLAVLAAGRPAAPGWERLPAPAAAPPLLGRWKEVADLLPRLGAAPEVRRAAVAEARRRLASLDLGPSAERWAFLIALGRWLDDPTRPLSAPGRIDRSAMVEAAARAGLQMEISPEEAIRLEALRALPDDASHESAVGAVRYLAEDLPDPACWLVLGRTLELESRERALIAYRRGLAQLAPGQLHAPFVLPWLALARALTQVPGHDAAAELAAFVLAEPGYPDKFAGLRAALMDVPGGTAIEARVLERAWASRKDDECAPALAIARLRLGATDADDLLREMLARQPDSGAYSFQFLSFYAACGRLPEIAPRAPALPLEPGMRSLMQLLVRDPAFTGMVAPAHDSWAYEARVFAVQGALEDGGLAGVAAPLRSLAPHPDVSTPRDILGALPFDLLALGDATPWLRPLVGELLTDPFRVVPLDWNRAAGAFSRPGAGALMEDMLARVRRRRPHDAELTAYEALWLSRAGRDADALRALSRAQAEGRGRAFFDHVTAEVLLRAQWNGAPGAPPAADLLPPDPVLACVEAVRDGRSAEARRRAAELAMAFPEQPVWRLVLLRDAALHGDAAALARERSALRIQARFSKLGLWIEREIAGYSRGR